MTYDTSHDRLNAISSRLGGVSRYLEIGVAKGSTFFAVDAPDKHAVDPRLCFDPISRGAHTNETYHCCTSDNYFADCLKKQTQPFDLIFLDGLHTYSQTLRDFMASQALAHSKTVWVIDDTVPSDPIAADPNLSRVKEARQLTEHPNDETWMGDVFKVIAFIDSYCPQFSCFTTEGRGQTVVLPLPRLHHETRFPNVGDIDNLDYVDVLLLRRNLLNPTPFKEVLKKMERIL